MAKFFSDFPVRAVRGPDGAILPGTFMPVVDRRDFPSLYRLGQEYIWEKAEFTVPAGTPDERVQAVGYRYRNKFGDILEWQGFTVLYMEGPYLDAGMFAHWDGVEGRFVEDRRRYIIRARVQRRPVEYRFDVPDEAVPELLAAGLDLKE